MEHRTSKNLESLEALQQEAAAFVATLEPKNEKIAYSATVVTLSGELGAGKTSFTQGLAQALGVTEPVTSPTFVLEKIYELPSRGFARLVHIDAYRLEGERSLTPLDFSELITDSKNLIVLEWPELVASQLPTVDVAIVFSVLSEGGRSISYTYA